MNFDNCYPTILRQAKLTLTENQYDIVAVNFGATGVVSMSNVVIIGDVVKKTKKALMIVHFDAEPMQESIVKQFALDMGSRHGSGDYEKIDYIIATSDSNYNHIANFYNNFSDFTVSENSSNKLSIWYYFLHGYIALDWFREYKFYSEELLIKNRKFDYSYITMNRLVDGARNYRLCLMSRLEEKNLTSNGLVSYSPYLADDSVYNLPQTEKMSVIKHCSHNKRFDLTGDAIPNDSMHINIDAHLSSFLNVVTETCFYQGFNHLTEKIFKPIVMMQPFVLASTAGSLEYLRRYGFKTFGDWIDESYDMITNPFRRLDAISAEVEKICRLTKSEQEAMYQEMLPTLQHNRQHFYGDFYSVLHEEMWDNFKSVLPES